MKFHHITFILLLSFFSTHLFAQSNLVDEAWLKKNLNAKNLVVIDMSDDTQYQRFHIPGAAHLPYGAINTQRKDKASVSIGQENMIKVMGLLGIKRDSQVVIYDDMGGLHAGRLYWEMTRLGHPKVALLDGGLVSWILAGNKVDNHPVQALKVVYKAKAGKDSFAVDESAFPVKKAQQVIDVRSVEEYVGNKKYPRSGHIPGAINWSWDNSLDIAAGFKLKPKQQLEKELKSLGIDKSKPTILYCRSGHRASQAFHTLRYLGFKDVKLYDASMKGYSKQKQLPMKLGKLP